jgi:hypothetical protein
MPTPADTLIVVLLVLLPVLYFYKDSLPLIGKPSKNSGDRAGVNGNGSKGGVEEEGDPRDWLEQMNKAVSCRSSCVVEKREKEVLTFSILVDLFSPSWSFSSSSHPIRRLISMTIPAH